jgi:hypothetical protein
MNTQTRVRTRASAAVLAATALLGAGEAQAYCTTRSDAPWMWDIKDNPVFNMTITVQNDGNCQIAAWESLGKIKEISILRRPETGRFQFIYEANSILYTPSPKKPPNDLAQIRFCAERFGNTGCVTINYNYVYGY